MKKGWLRHLDFIIIDTLAIECSLILCYLVSVNIFHYDNSEYQRMFLFMPIVNLCLANAMDNYNGILQRGYLLEFAALLKLECIIFLIVQFSLYFLKWNVSFSRKILIFYFFINFLLTYIGRFSQKFYLSHRYKKEKYIRQIVIATTEQFARDMISTITESAIRNYQFFGLAVLDKQMTGQQIKDITVSAGKEDFIQYIQNHVVDEVLVNIPDQPKLTLSIAQELLDMGIIVHIYMEHDYQQLPNRHISNVFGYNVLTSSISPISFYHSLLKRGADILGGIIGCIICVIIGLFIGPVIYMKSPGPIIFSQTRIGKNGRPFKFYKFRSMYMDAEKRKQELMEKNRIKNGFMFKLDDDPRIIKGIGHFIRKTSLDEFPQFWNVLKGDMSLVGTRPPTIDEYEHYAPHHKKRLSLKPGITGLWQVSGRSNITDFEDVVQLDAEYIENWSLSLDLKILLKTVFEVFKRNGSM